MLGRQVHLHIGIPVVRRAMGSRLLGVNRLPRNAFADSQVIRQLGGFPALVHAPAIASADLHRLIIAGLKFPLRIGRIILFCQLGDVFRNHRLIHRNLSAVPAQPFVGSIPIQDLLLIPEGIGHGRIDVAVSGVPLRRQSLIVP